MGLSCSNNRERFVWSNKYHSHCRYSCNNASVAVSTEFNRCWMRVSALLSGDAAKVELELVKKLHTKPKNSTNPDDDGLFYPVVYQDTTSGRSGIYYVREEEYAKDIGSCIEAIKYNSLFLRDGYAVKAN